MKHETRIVGTILVKMAFFSGKTCLNLFVLPLGNAIFITRIFARGSATQVSILSGISALFLFQATVVPAPVVYGGGPHGYTPAPAPAQAAQAPPNWIVQQQQQQQQPGLPKYQLPIQQQQQAVLNQPGKEALRTYMSSRSTAPQGAPFPMVRQNSAEGYPQPQSTQHQQAQMMQMEQVRNGIQDVSLNVDMGFVTRIWQPARASNLSVTRL